MSFIKRNKGNFLNRTAHSSWHFTNWQNKFNGTPSRGV